MKFPLVASINETINSNLSRRAVTFYNGKEWTDHSYARMKEEIHEVRSILKETIIECGTQYVLLHLDITHTYPSIVLGVLNAEFGFLCVDPSADSIINYVEEFSIEYIISNIYVDKSQTSFLSNVTFEKNINLSGEIVGLWTVCNETHTYTDIPFIYAIKTSGTTGIAKKVQVSHDCIFPNLKDLSAILQISCEDVIVLMTSITFDPSVIELFLALMNGATLCIIEKNFKQNHALLLDILFPLSGGLVTVMQTTPSLFRRWNASAIQQRLFSEKSLLRNLILGGEEFPSINELKLWGLPESINIYNIYGITEVSCWATINQVWPSKDIDIDIGESLSETILQLDMENENEGELFIGSKRRKCLINNETVEDIFNCNKTVFRATGDIFKKVNGNLYFKRRKDDILKRWGIQFSTSSIEEIVKVNENIAACACTAVQIYHHVRIGLFVVEKKSSDLKDLKQYLKKHLTKASWPDTIIALDSFQLTSHGKICMQTLRKKLLDEKRPKSKETFKELWRHYSSENSLGINDFFADGGDSLTALQLVEELKLVFDDLPDAILTMILQRKTYNEICSYFQNYEVSEHIKKQSSEQNKAVTSPSCEIANSRNIVSKMVLKGKIISFDNNVSCVIITKPGQFKEVWKHNLGKCIDASPLGIVLKSGENICIIGSHSGRVAVIEVNTGKLISLCILPDRVESPASISVDAKFYYIGCYDGCVYCVTINSGKVAWKFKTEEMVKSACIIIANWIVFGSYDRNIYCLDKDGFLKWKTLLRSPVLAEPVLNYDFLYTATLGSVAALNVKTGQLLWEIAHEPIFSTPVFNDTVLIVASVSGCVKWLKAENGKEEFIFRINDMIFSSLVKYVINEKEIVIFGSQDGSLYCLQEKQLLWKTVLDARVVSTPFVELSEATSNGFVVCSSTKGTVYIINFNTGEKISQYSLPGEVFSSPILISGKIIVGCRDDNVYCLDIQ